MIKNVRTGNENEMLILYLAIQINLRIEPMTDDYIYVYSVHRSANTYFYNQISIFFYFLQNCLVKKNVFITNSTTITAHFSKSN